MHIRVHVREGILYVGHLDVARCVQYRTEHGEVVAYGHLAPMWRNTMWWDHVSGTHVSGKEAEWTI